MNDLFRCLKAAFGIEVFDNSNTMGPEDPIPFMVVDCPGRRVREVAIHLENPPLPIDTDEKIRFGVSAFPCRCHPAEAIGEEQDPGMIQRLRDTHLRLGTEPQIVPHMHHASRAGQYHALIGNAPAAKPTSSSRHEGSISMSSAPTVLCFM